MSCGAKRDKYDGAKRGPHLEEEGTAKDAAARLHLEEEGTAEDAAACAISLEVLLTVLGALCVLNNNDGSDDGDAECIFCHELFSRSQPDEEWVKCKECLTCPVLPHSRGKTGQLHCLGF